MELTLRFTDEKHVEVKLEERESGLLDFQNPLAAPDFADLRWYIETYGANSLGDPDDQRAAHIAARLPKWGKDLFNAVFTNRDAQDMLHDFQKYEDGPRLLTITAQHPAILALPWEMLHDSARGGVFLFNDNPRVSIRRKVAGATGGRAPFRLNPKESVHLLFVVSRPVNAGFIDPRLDPLAILDALESHAPGRVTWEFLRPPTHDALVDRLRDREQKPVDILHFDGHGVFDRDGGLPERARKVDAARRFSLEEIMLRVKSGTGVPADQPPSTGYLLFEDGEGRAKFVSGRDLARDLYKQKVGLVVLSACQSAAHGGDGKKRAGDETGTQPEDAPSTAPEAREVHKDREEAMGSVAAGLTATGIPAVLAMTHSVLVHTTAALFGRFYQDLARSRTIGEALDNARAYLQRNPEKYEVQRGRERRKLALHDWFVPALYESGADGALLTAKRRAENRPSPGGPSGETSERPDGLVAPRPEAGFFGRTRELWDIERWFAAGTRRISISGFGGQGKSELAREAGRWLTRTGLFDQAVFVDYSRYQGEDAAGYAVACIGGVLGESLVDPEAATEALTRTPTLVILDNLEALIRTARDGAEDLSGLHGLLDAALAWSEAGSSRVLLTTRRPDYQHAAYPGDSTNRHRVIRLGGLGNKKSPEDALAWFAALFKLGTAPSVPTTPERTPLINLFAEIRFHPLSIRVLAQQLKTRGIAEVGERLALLLREGAGGAASPSGPAPEDTPAGLVASLHLSLDRLDARARGLLPRLGVFRGGALESSLLAITAIAEDEWRPLRRQLEDAALIEAETLPGVNFPFLRFHPTLAPLLWGELEPEARTNLSHAHRKLYQAMANHLYKEDRRHPHQARAIVWRELPNLLAAVHGGLDEGEPRAADFADSVNWFLDCFGLKREAKGLTDKAFDVAGEPGSPGWVLIHSNRGEQLLNAGQVAEAERRFREILAVLGETPTFERALTLGRLGRCFEAGGRPAPAEARYREALMVLDRLESSDGVKRQRGGWWTNLADVLRHQGCYGEARTAYEAGLELFKELGDTRNQGVSLGQLGTLALIEGELGEAAERYREALSLFRQLGEPAMEAVACHQLGMVFEEARQWDEAERHYREAARLREEQGNQAGAASTWNQLAVVCQNAGKPDAATAWYRRAIAAARKHGMHKELAIRLSNLANLLQGRPGGLDEARAAAEEALALKQSLDPGAAQIWNVYTILAEIADKEAAAASSHDDRTQSAQAARNCRSQALAAKRAFAGTRFELQRFLPFLGAVVKTLGHPEHAAELENILHQGEQNGLHQLSAAIRRLSSGERNIDELIVGLGSTSAILIDTILRSLDDPAVLTDLAAPESPPTASDSDQSSQAATLPPEIRAALEAGDMEKLQAALAALPPEQAATIIQMLQSMAQQME